MTAGTEGHYTIVPATTADFARVYPLLAKFGNRDLTREAWQGLFTHGWGEPSGSRGLMLVRGEEVKGFLGLIFSRRVVDGRDAAFCNMTSWIVQDDSRNHSLGMLRSALTAPGMTVTNFTASAGVAALLRRFGFRGAPQPMRLLLRFPFPGRGIECEFDRLRIAAQVDRETQRIFEDHAAHGCQVALIHDGGDNCAVVLKRFVWSIRSHGIRARVPLCRVHYVSDTLHAGVLLSRARAALCARVGARGLLADARWFDGVRAPLSFAFGGGEGEVLVKSDWADPATVDTLYSEMILLHQ